MSIKKAIYRNRPLHSKKIYSMTNVKKVCTKCKEEKPVVDFHFRKDRNDYRADCKSCRSESEKERKLQNPGKFKERCKASNERRKSKIDAYQAAYRESRRELLCNKSKEFYHANSEQVNALKEKRRLQNRDSDLSAKRKWYQENKERHAVARVKYESKNKDRLREARREWENDRLKTDINYKLQKGLCRRIRTALKESGLRKEQATAELVGCSVADLKEHLLKQFKAGMTWDNHGTLWQIDHCVPLSWFNLSNENCRKLAFSYKNMQPLYSIENNKKKNKFHHPIHL